MTTIPDPIHTIASLIDKHHESQEERPRPHLGASMIGHPCRRWLWLSFRWAVVSHFPGRVRRLFRRGQNEEATVVADLRAIGCAVDAEEDGRQHRVDFGGHFSGSMDGVIRSGVPEAPEKPHVLEIKTHSLKSFKHLCDNGVKGSKPQHWAQMQVYMLGAGIDRALYYSVCKDDDAIYTERVRLEKREAEKLLKKAHQVIASDRMPEPISADPSWYQCKFCDGHDICHGSRTTDQVNCRTCAHSTPVDGGKWHCARWGSEVPTEFQYAGCDDHVLHPDLVRWQMAPGDDDLSAVYIINGAKVRNGHGGVKSRDLLESAEAFASNDAVAGFASHFDATITKVRSHAS